MLSQKQVDALGELFCPLISKPEIEQAINARVNQQTELMRKADDSNILRSQWAEVTARMAAERLGWRFCDVIRELKKDGNNLAKTEQNNGAIVLKTGLREKIKSKGLTIAREEKIKLLVRSWKKKTESLGCNEKQSSMVAQCMAELQLTQIQTGLIENSSKLLELLVGGITGIPINISELHCIPRVMNSEVGFDISSETVFVNTLADGSEEVADQRLEIDGFLPIVNIFKKFNIRADLEILLMDLDTFILDTPENDKKVLRFAQNMHELMRSMGLSVKISRASEKLGLENVGDFKLLPEVKEICRDPVKITSERSVEKLVDEMFEKNQSRDLPACLKTRQATREFAGLRLAIEIMMGRTLPKPNTLFIQRSTTKAAGELFLSSAKKIKQSPPMLFFWVDRWK